MRNNLLRASMVFLMLLVAAIQGCNTMEGMGKDIERTGQAIEEEASD